MNESIKIEKISQDIFGISTPSFYLIGYYEKININTSKVNLISWYDKKTKRYKTPRNKLYNHMTRYFNYIIEKYGAEAD